MARMVPQSTTQSVSNHNLPSPSKRRTDQNMIFESNEVSAGMEHPGTPTPYGQNYLQMQNRGQGATFGLNN